MAVRIESRAEPIPGYRLIERLGGGGFGEVWKAEAPGGLHKAIKFVFGDLRTATEPEQGEGMMVRASQELKALNRVKTVRHPYILSLERYDIVDGQLMIVMELADKSLWDRFRECRSQGFPGIPREELLRYMEETAEALDLMNGEHQLQHLDIKPQNLFLIHNHIKVADFGLVKDLEGMVASVTGGVTPVYAAPETFDGWVSRFCDQYSLGIVYQELLTGHRPFAGTNVRQLVMQHLQGVPNLAPLSPAERPLIARALAKNPDERYPTCTEFVKALRAAGTEPPTATLQELALGSLPSRDDFVEGRTTPSERDDETSRTTASIQPRASAQVHAVKSHDPASLSAPRMPTSIRPAPPLPTVMPDGPHSVPLDIAGDGVLLPSLIIGLGGLGLQLLQRFRALLLRQFGTLDAVPNLRLLHVDTDPDARQVVGAASPEECLSANEVFLTRLSRPSHYLRSSEGKANLDAWMDVQMLYRIPRTPATTGVRALGRLAFFDNYKSVARRIQDEIETCLAPESLQAACQETGLTLRSNRPRVYVLTSLGGGTGSGMFLDLAYLVRSLLLKKGYVNPDVVGIFLLPPVDRQATRGLALANAYAALTELHHFSAPGNSFSARYLDKEPPVVDAGPPFSRCVLLPMPEQRESTQVRELLGLTAEFLTRDLLTPLGRLADLCRSRLPGFAAPSQGLTCQSFGLYRFSWPRQALLRRVARRMCCHLVQRWATKDSAPLQEVVRERVGGEWANRGLTPEGVIDELQRACAKTLGETPESAFATITTSLPLPAGKAPEIDPSVYAEAFAKLEKIVGRLDADTMTRPPALIEGLTQGSAALVSRWCKQLEAITADLVEEPQYRLAGAEEALRQFMATIQKTLEHYEPLGTELGDRVAEARSRIDALLTSLQGGRRTVQLATGLVELLKQYPKWRYQSLVLQQLTATYVSLRGRLSDQLREINFCRARLHDLAHSLTETPTNDRQRDARPGREFFPGDSRDLGEATEQFFEDFQPDDWQTLDVQMQELMQREFSGLVQICLAPANCLPRLEAALIGCAEAFVSADLASHDVAEMFLTRHKEEQTALEEIAAAFDEAAPEFASARLSRQPEICILAAPATPAGERFRLLANQSLPDIAPVFAAGGDDIVFYREVPQLLVVNLDQLGPQGQEAYQQMLSVAQFTPHSRRDISPWQPVQSG